MKCERRTPQQASGGSPTRVQMLAMEVAKERTSPVSAPAQPNNNANAQPPQQPQICAGCSKVITERYLLKALDQLWHEDCLKCGCCDCRLGEVGHTLYTRANLILCKRDYLRLFGNTGYCAACNKVIPAFEMVMRARSNVYHLECFACQQCNHRFCVGDRFYLCENKILCEYDYEERLVFANMAYNPPPLAHLKRQTTHLPPPPTSNAMSALMNGSSRAGDLSRAPAPQAPRPLSLQLRLSSLSPPLRQVSKLNAPAKVKCELYANSRPKQCTQFFRSLLRASYTDNLSSSDSIGSSVFT
ncbi:LIM domain transcription factor LMO4.1-like [Pectinophora gossypiella]|uniref:LIM domain transcription factor LMO4.1-like n=1 Tax=Pectinophora gossypiella TaxID=13191 RepID=UPI00214EAF2D|nr:LIM domain transcription factor LMO4.1-like [Pectinophora gossypiella]